MDRSSVLTLISQTFEKDSIGQQVPKQVRRDVFCNLTSVSASEFFQAGSVGLKPEYRATVFQPDYQGETIAELDGKLYQIYRTYLGKYEMIELYLERKVGV